jgi:hypothetical protein
MEMRNSSLFSVKMHKYPQFFIGNARILIHDHFVDHYGAGTFSWDDDGAGFFSLG